MAKFSDIIERCCYYFIGRIYLSTPLGVGGRLGGRTRSRHCLMVMTRRTVGTVARAVGTSRSSATALSYLVSPELLLIVKLQQLLFLLDQLALLKPCLEHETTGTIIPVLSAWLQLTPKSIRFRVCNVQC